MPYKDPVVRKIKSLERSLRWAANNPEKVKAKQKRYRVKNHDKVLERHRAWFVINKRKAYEATRKWKKENSEKVNSTKRIYNHNKYHTNTQHKITVLLRSRIRTALKNNQKSGSAVKDLGCTISELKFYLEGQFQDGMTWDNWSKEGWHIDHKIPLAFFDLTDREQFLAAVHYTNLQPMWAKENIRKSNKVMI